MVVALGPDELMKQIYCLSAIKLWQGTIPSNGDLPPVIDLLPEVLCPLGVAWSYPRRAVRGARPKTARVNWRSRFTLPARECPVEERGFGLVCLGPVGAAASIDDQLNVQMHRRVGGVFHY